MIKLYASMFLTLSLLVGMLIAMVTFLCLYFNLSSIHIIAITLSFSLIQWYISPSIIEAMHGIRYLKEDELPWLHRMVEELCKKVKLKKPRIGLINAKSPNAFVFGRHKGDARLIVTKGLIENLDRDEIRAVIAHELGHIKHGDMLVMTFASFIPLLAYFIYISTWDRDESSLIAMGAFFVYFVSNLLVLALSRLREYYADRFSAEKTNARHLISALVKICYGCAKYRDLNEGMRSFYIADPILARKEIREAMEAERRSKFLHLLEIFQTHPLTYKRIEALKELIK